VSANLRWVAECGGRASRLFAAAEASRANILRLCQELNITQTRGKRIIGEVLEAVGRWKVFAVEAGVRNSRQREIAKALESERLRFSK
jgi:hypothetical protein